MSDLPYLFSLFLTSDIIGRLEGMVQVPSKLEAPVYEVCWMKKGLYQIWGRVPEDIMSILERPG